jgi:predicted Zn-dependent peptidase
VPSYHLAHERRYAASLLNIILGGGMSSRLFQNIRERQGLAYAIFSELSPYTDTREQVLEIARDFFHPQQLALTVLGDLKGLQATPELLAW